MEGLKVVEGYVWKVTGGVVGTLGVHYGFTLFARVYWHEVLAGVSEGVQTTCWEAGGGTLYVSYALFSMSGLSLDMSRHSSYLLMLVVLLNCLVCDILLFTLT